MNNTRFATALHIMVLLAKYPDELLTSDWLAGSININPVIVRKELITLRNAGFIESRKGKVGGSALSRSAQKIKISEIFNAIKNAEVMGKKNLYPNPKCSVGKEINAKLNFLYQQADRTIEKFLSGITLADFAKEFA